MSECLSPGEGPPVRDAESLEVKRLRALLVDEQGVPGGMVIHQDDGMFLGEQHACLPFGELLRPVEPSVSYPALPLEGGSQGGIDGVAFTRWHLWRACPWSRVVLAVVLQQLWVLLRSGKTVLFASLLSVWRAHPCIWHTMLFPGLVAAGSAYAESCVWTGETALFCLWFCRPCISVVTLLSKINCLLREAFRQCAGMVSTAAEYRERMNG